MTIFRRRLLAAAGISLASQLPMLAHVQNCPDHPIRLAVGYARRELRPTFLRACLPCAFRSN